MPEDISIRFYTFSRKFDKASTKRAEPVFLRKQIPGRPRQHMPGFIIQPVGALEDSKVQRHNFELFGPSAIDREDRKFT